MKINENIAKQFEEIFLLPKHLETTETFSKRNLKENVINFVFPNVNRFFSTVNNNEMCLKIYN